MSATPEHLRWRRLVAATRQHTEALAAFFTVLFVGIYVGCGWAGVPWMLAGITAIYITGLAAVGLWASAVYLAIPVMISMTCALPVTSMAAVSTGAWALAVFIVLLVPGLIGFGVGRIARYVLLVVDGGKS